MMENSSSEIGITPTVRTFFSRYTVFDILDRICTGKVNAVLDWLTEGGIHPENCLIIGSYLTGARLANRLKGTSSVTVLDIHPHLRCFLDPEVAFETDVHALDTRNWDFIMDTSGLGGINPIDLQRLQSPRAFLVEDPASDGSDEYLLNINHTKALLDVFSAREAGIVWTDGLCAKTSGTMTLTMEILRRSMRDAALEEGALYSTASMEFYERMLFQEKNPDAFLERLNRPALVVSSLKDVDCDGIIEQNLVALRSRVICWKGPGS